MLSTDNPPDPSCSSNPSALKSHEKASEKVAFQEGEAVVLEEKPTPNFSIRDYVLSSRSKGIEASWPFPQQFLQFCLKHGAKDLLPPFEPPDLVRAQCLKASQPAEQTVACSETDNISADVDLHEPRYAGPFNEKLASIRLESHLQLKELIPNSSDPHIESSSQGGHSTVDEGTNLDELIHLDANITSTVRTHHPTEQSSEQNADLNCSVAASRNASEIPLELGATEPRQNFEKLCKPLEKKCRLKVKLSAIPGTSQVDNIVSNSSTVSDPMASKVCPVCKTFSSTSNTTLNAHIDQCLSMESNTKSILSEVPKIKVKQRKKKLMSEIYMTAPHCTLEDLDRRNGTNWAVELALLAAPTSLVGHEAKRTKLSTAESVDNGDDGAVYVDSNGMKVRILSKVDDAPLEEDLNLTKHARDIKAGKSVLYRKKKTFTSKYPKIMKVKSQRKKLRPFKLLKNQFVATPEGDHRSTDHQQNEHQPFMTHTEHQVKSSAPATLRQWVCSIRSDTPKAPTDKSRNITLEGTSSVNKTILAESSQSDPCNHSAVRSHQNKLSRSSEFLTGSPKMKRVDCLYNDFHPMNDVKRKSSEPVISNSRWSSKSSNCANGLLLKLSKSSDTFKSSRSKSMEIDMSIQHKSDKCSNLEMEPLESCPPLLKEQAIFASKNSILVKRPYFHLEGRKVEASERPSTSLNFRKHRSILRTGKRGPPYVLPMNGVHGTTKSFGLNVTRKNRTVCTRQSGLLNNFTRSESKVMNQGSPNHGNTPDSEKQESSGTVEELEDNSLNKLPLGSGCHGTQIEDSAVQLEAPDSEAMGDGVGDPTSDDFMNSDNMGINVSTESNSCACADDVLSISGSEVHVQRLKQRSDQKEIVGDGVSCNEIDHQDIQMTIEAADRGGRDSCAVQPTDCQVETTSVQDSSGCLTSHEDVELALPRKNPSITSFLATADHDKYLSSNSGPSGSPHSTGSTISLPSSEDYKLKDLEAEPLPRVISVQDKLGLTSQTAASIRPAEQRNCTVWNEEVKENLPAEVPDKCLEDLPFCCSCRESISRDSQFFRQNETSRTAKANQVPNLLIRPRISSSFSTYQNWSTVVVGNSRLESSDQSISINNSLDSTAKHPTCIGLGSPSPSPQSHNQSTSSPILRLMGKNLMVVNNQQLVQPQNSALDYAPNVNSVSHGFASTNILKQEGSSHTYHQLLGGSPAISQALPTGDHQRLLHLPITAMGGIVRPPFHFHWTTKTDQWTQQKKPYKIPNSSRDPYMTDDVIVIDDSQPEHENEFRDRLASTGSSLLLTTSGPSHLPQRSFSHFPSESQSRSISVGRGALHPNFHPIVDASFVNQGINSEGQGPLLPRPIFQSPTGGQMGPSMYYSPILR